MKPMTEAQSFMLRAFFIPIFVRNDAKLSRQVEATHVKKAELKGVHMKRTDITTLFPDATKEQIDQIMNLNGADINTVRSGLDQLKAQHADELQKAQDATAKLQKQLEELTAANALRDLRDKVAKETGVPSDLLTGSTEEEFKTRAEAIKAYAGSQTGYPNVPDGGEVTNTPKTSTRDQFANWFNENTK